MSPAAVSWSMSPARPLAALRLARRALAAVAAGLALATAAAPAYFPPDQPPAPAYTLPELLRTRDGQVVTTSEAWEATRRPEILDLFRTYVYGRVPDTPFTQHASVVGVYPNVLGGIATRKDVVIALTRAGRKPVEIHLVLYTPARAHGPCPAFLLMGNASIDKFDPMQAGANGYWPVAEGVGRGYAMAAFWSWDVDPDLNSDRVFRDGIQGLLDTAPRTSDSWATIAGWAWGMSRCLDYLQTDPAIRGDQVAVVGHSRAGKTALWAAAQDRRFAMACANESGHAGAALSRHRTPWKETVALINTQFPHWFADAYKRYNDREDMLPVDQHMLLALIAPRPVCVGSADQDLWSDPRGEFLGLVAAQPAYALFGRKGFGPDPRMPPIGEILNGDGLHYHIRAGKHGLTRADWEAYFAAADQEYVQPSSRLNQAAR